MDTLYTFGDNTTQYKTESVPFLGLMNSATKKARGLGFKFPFWGEPGDPELVNRKP